jgi:leucyl aminopeptidase (aminopeptidase T)
MNNRSRKSGVRGHIGHSTDLFALASSRPHAEAARNSGGPDMLEMELMHSAQRIIVDMIRVTAKDKVLVITDEAKLNIGKVFGSICRGLGAETVMAIMPMTGEHGNEPPATIAAAMAAADVVFAPTTHSLTHTRARLNAHAAGCRVVILRGVDEDMMVKGGMAVDPKEVKKITARVARALGETQEIRVTSPSGTDVTFSVAGRKFFTLDGYFQEEMGFAALPGGECPTSPVEGTSHGRIVVDYSMDSIGLLKQPLVFEVKKGRVQSVSGSPGEVRVLEYLFEKDNNARNIAEFAIGTNPGARLIGNLAEDKKALGTAHFAVGDSLSLGGKVEATVHLDGLLLNPTVLVNGRRVLLERGKLKV